MATKRFRNGKFQYVVKNKKLLPKPLYFTFDNEADGEAYIRELEDLLDKGLYLLSFNHIIPILIGYSLVSHG